MKATNNRLWKLLSLYLTLGLALAIGALIFLAWLSEEVLEGETRSFDETTRAALHKLASPTLTQLMHGFSFLGSTLFLLAATVVIVMWFAFRHWGREAILLGVTMIGASLLNTTLKLAFKRARPTPFFNLLAPSSYSFPSGHALAGFCFWGALAAILTTRIKNKSLRVGIWITSAAVILLIGCSRIYLGVHYTTDVLAGFLAALIWVLVVRFAEVELSRRRSKNRLKTTS